MAFTKEVNERFHNLKITLPHIPEQYQISNLTKPQKKFEFTTADSYLAFLLQEKLFWETYRNILFLGRYVHCYERAINRLNNVIRYVNTPSSFNAEIRASLEEIKNIPFSKSILAKELIKHVGFPEEYFNGFLFAINKNEKTFSYYNHKYYILGMMRGFQYLDLIKQMDEIQETQKACIEESVINLQNTADGCIQKSNDLFYAKTKEFKELDINIKKELATQRTEFDNFSKERASNMDTLEKLYGEKLALSKPAEYWEEHYKKYQKKGHLTLGLSFGIIILSIVALTLLIVYVPTTDITSHWYDLIKNTAIYTLIASILLYSIRITVKMAMSSYHLARDAKERKQLSYFYLSLMNEKAISDNERELIISALFSRTDSGLLKGEATPEMPNINITELLNKK